MVTLWSQRNGHGQLLKQWVTLDFLSAQSMLAILLQPLTSTRYFHPENRCSLDIFSFSDHFLPTLCGKIPADQSFLKHSDKPAWHQQLCHVQSLKSPFFSILMLSLNFSRSPWPCLHAWMHRVADMWLADQTFALMSSCTGITNEVVGECILHLGYKTHHLAFLCYLLLFSILKYFLFLNIFKNKCNIISSLKPQNNLWSNKSNPDSLSGHRQHKGEGSSALAVQKATSVMVILDNLHICEGTINA